MKFYSDGDKGKAICDHCKDVVPTTYERRDVPFSEGEGMAKNILVATCDHCKQVVAIPAQSTPAIKESRKTALKSIEARLPAVYLDALDFAMLSVNSAASTQHRKLFVNYYLMHFTKHKSELIKAHKHAIKHFKINDDALKVERRLSMKVSFSIAQDIEVLKEKTQLSATEIIKSLIFKMNEDLVSHKKPEVIKQLETITAVAC